MSGELKERIGGRLRELRQERLTADPRWTQEYVARQFETMTGNQLSRYERGERLPRGERLEALAALYGTTVADLYLGPLAGRSEVPEIVDEPDGRLLLVEIKRVVDENRERLDLLDAALGLLGAKLDDLAGAGAPDRGRPHSAHRPSGGKAAGQSGSRPADSR